MTPTPADVAFEQTIERSEDIVKVRAQVRLLGESLNMPLVSMTKLLTATSELARNVLVHGRGGRCRGWIVQNAGRRGVAASFEDNGPGIADLARAMTDGFTTGTGMGLGLGGAKRLVNEFEIESEVDHGTRIRIVRWS